jgi:cytidine deaminase
VAISEAVLDALKRRAREAAAHAYAPYSGFAVGAAVLTDGGEIHSSTNVENASFGLSNCA